jgi:peptidoglycan/xylan/chitin deacetylase (PgdA/CDA1 family)
MTPPDAQPRRRAQPSRPTPPYARYGAVGALAAVIVIVFAIILGTRGGSSPKPTQTANDQASKSTKHSGSKSGTSTGKPGTVHVPVLAYRVINVPPAGVSSGRDLYVPSSEFSAQMTALKSGGWHAVTLNQLQAYWTHGTSLGTTKPIVITFDGGYASHYVNALPVLKQLGWHAVENLQANGLSPSDGGLTDSQVHGLLSAGWELDLEGSSQPDLTTSDSSTATSQVTADRQALHSRFNVPVNWFAYPSGRYNATVTGAVRTAGFVGASTLSPGWADPKGDRFLLPRLQVVAGTSPTALVSQISGAQQNGAPPPESSGI